MEEITVVGLILVVGGMAVKSFLDWLKQKNLQNSEVRLEGVESSVKKLTDFVLEHDKNHDVSNERIKELHEWHNRRDADGVPVWYVRQSLEQVIKQNGEAVSILAQQSVIQTQILKEIVESQKEILIRIHSSNTASIQ